MVGACIGFVGIIGVRVLVLGDSFDGLHSKFAETGMLETVGVSLLAILILLFSIFLQVLLHEGGHLVCGLATGYRFVSFRIFNLTFIRKDGKLCIKRFSLAGTGGQCLLTPPERPLEDIPTTLYNLGGVLANLLTAILAFLPLLTVDGLPYLLKFFLLMLSLIGILLAGMNGIPMKMGGIGKMLDMIPGLGAGKISEDDIAKGEKEFKQMEAIIYSMTPAERKNPSLLNASRRKRIAAGSGQPVSKINSLIKKYEDTKKLMKQFSSPGFMKKNKRLKGLF